MILTNDYSVAVLATLTLSKAENTKSIQPEDNIMSIRKKVDLESLITKEEFDKINDIRRVELPKYAGRIGEGGHGYVDLYKLKNGNLIAGKQPKLNLLTRTEEEITKIKEVFEAFFFLLMSETGILR